MDMNLVIKTASEGAAKYAGRELEVLRKFCAIDCGSRNIEGNRQVVDIVCEELSCIEGIKIERRFSEGYGEHIIASLKPENAQGKLIINAHLDTVFNPGDTAKYPYREEGDTAWGLGISDCKAGVVIPIFAVKAMQEAGMLPDKEIVFVYNCDEEIGSGAAEPIFEEVATGAEMAFVFEPARDDDGIITARKASCSYTIECTGKSAHSGNNYEDGRSAVLELCHRITRLYQSNDDARGIQFNTGKLWGSEYGNNVVPDHARATGSVRVANKADIQEVLDICAAVEAEAPFIEGTTCKITVDEIGKPMERNEANLALYAKMKAVGNLMDMELPEQAAGGGSDASYFSFLGVPALDALGGYIITGMHSYEECFRISSLEDKTKLFAAFLGSLK